MQDYEQLYTARGAKLRDNPSLVPWQEHPRPLLRRNSILNLCGWWSFSVWEKGVRIDAGVDRIRVPFPPESLLSGVHRHFEEGTALVYERHVEIPAGFRKKRLLLHIDGADQHAEVHVDGLQIASHDGGYEHFTVDITEVADTFSLEIVVRDDLNDLTEPYGKQRLRRGGMWYTPFSGLWQPVWIESVPTEYVRELRIRTDMMCAEIYTGDVSQHGELIIQTPEGELCQRLVNGRAVITPDKQHLWTPEEPYLYYFTLRLDGGDTVHSYFALRKIDCGKVDGVPRILLNGKPYFFHGLLDQGYWSDGLSTPADPQTYEDDINAIKELGFNTLRKHIRVEPDLFYAACDRRGVVVFQDMVNNGDYSFVRDTALPNIGFLRRDDRKLHRDPRTREKFLLRMEQTVRQLQPFPCILYWTIFNEGWGQFESLSVCEKLRTLDPDRLIDATSGWFDNGAGDVTSVHVYNRKYQFAPSEKPVVLSECGGYALRIDGHIFNPEKAYGYGQMKRTEDYVERVERLYCEEILPAIGKDLCGCIYTQVSDVEDEINGIMTFDRQVTKLDSALMTEIAKQIRVSACG